ncbi:dihydrofolate reductase family protein [Leptospira jelokensis]|uniref:diaminohydroxyphosphoribosylaminopyrimidine deaminase n=1 Tax=Leptospira jelokensis TaxID=2484931 RepID=A0A4Z0ZV10_9LEPT|nr:dihydrofolate reductase family protein [Leptospira jelokensis]TGL72380.1 deaminase [Leptospira jelokensis]
MDVGKKKELYSLHSLLGFLAMGKTGGNPPVSAVLTSLDGEVLAKAHTQGFGGNHAERELFSQLETHRPENHNQNQGIPSHGNRDQPNLTENQTGARFTESILSVSLEPCTHFGKTPPCRDLVLTSNPKELLIGWKDPNPLVLSGDWKPYQDQGIGVRLDPVLANTSLPYLQGFIKRMKTGLPWVWIKSATSKEGNFASSSRKKERVSGEEVDLFLQILRAKFDAVAVGPNTIYTDEPSLHFRITESMIQNAALPKRVTDLVPFFDAKTNLMSAVCQWAKDTASIHLLEEGNYQPYRVFVLDPNQLPKESFWKKQEELTEQFGKKLCLFFLKGSNDPNQSEGLSLPEETKNKMESLSLHPIVRLGKGDGEVFLKTLGNLGINTVLCEAGSFFPSFLQESLSDEDCILEIRNHKKSIAHGIPFVYIEEPIVSEFRVGSNSLFIRNPKRSH